MASVTTVPFIPELIPAHVRPASVLLKAPEKLVPAYNVSGLCGSMTATVTGTALKFVLIAIQLTPPSVLLNAPKRLAAYNVFEFRGSTVKEFAYKLLFRTLQPRPPLVLL